MRTAHRDELMKSRKTRFEAHLPRNPAMDWAMLEARLNGAADALVSLLAMERRGGEPDIVGSDPATGALVSVDCAPESPVSRRSLRCDRDALDARARKKPAGCGVDVPTSMGVSLLTEAQYRHLGGFGAFDRKTSSRVHTPARNRTLGGAVFCDRRYDEMFLYHNGSEFYFAARGFRARLGI